MEDININKVKKLLESKEAMIRSRDEIIEILKRENKSLQDRIMELEKKTA